MLKGQKKQTDKEQGKTKHNAPCSVNYRASQNKNNIGTTILERTVVYTTGGFKGLLLYKLHPAVVHKYTHKTISVSDLILNSQESTYSAHMSLRN